MKILKNVPFSREEIDPAWLTSALRDSGVIAEEEVVDVTHRVICLLYTSPSPRDVEESRMPSSA